MRLEALVGGMVGLPARTIRVLASRHFAAKCHGVASASTWLAIARCASASWLGAVGGLVSLVGGMRSASLREPFGCSLRCAPERSAPGARHFAAKCLGVASAWTWVAVARGAAPSLSRVRGRTGAVGGRHGVGLPARTIWVLASLCAQAVGSGAHSSAATVLGWGWPRLGSRTRWAWSYRCLWRLRKLRVADGSVHLGGRETSRVGHHGRSPELARAAGSG